MSDLVPKLANYPIRTVEKLRFADTDRHGHITNSVFAVCCQNARMELLCDPHRVPIPPNTHFVIARLLLEFCAEMHWPGSIEIGTRIDRVGRSSITLGQALFVAAAVRGDQQIRGGADGRSDAAIDGPSPTDDRGTARDGAAHR